jgi:hypothetical protein
MRRSTRSAQCRCCSPATSRSPSPSGRCRTGRWCSWRWPYGTRVRSRPRTARGDLVARSRRASTRWYRSRRDGRRDGGVPPPLGW